MDSYESIYEQIYIFYKKLIEGAVYKEGEQLPSVRTEALSRGVNPNTVQRAYSRLENDGYIVTIPKKGVYVSYSGTVKKNPLVEALKELQREGYSLDSIEEAIKVLKEEEQ